MAGVDLWAGEAGLYVAEEVSRGLRSQVSGLTAEAQGAGRWRLEPAKAEASAAAGAATGPGAAPDPVAEPGGAGLFACGCPSCAKDLAAESEQLQSPLGVEGQVIRSVVPTNTDID